MAEAGLVCSTLLAHAADSTLHGPCVTWPQMLGLLQTKAMMPSLLRCHSPGKLSWGHGHYISHCVMIRAGAEDMPPHPNPASSGLQDWQGPCLLGIPSLLQKTFVGGPSPLFLWRWTGLALGIHHCSVPAHAFQAWLAGCSPGLGTRPWEDQRESVPGAGILGLLPCW